MLYCSCKGIYIKRLFHMKKGLLIIPVLASTLLLGGCGNQSSPQHKGTDSTQTSKVAKNSHVSHASSKAQQSSEEDQGLWNQSKSQKLAAYMQTWGNAMGQHYESYGPNHDTNFYGCAFPSQLDQILLKVDNQTVTMKWSNDGTGNATYNIVGIYCDSANAKPMDAHLYFFTFHDDEPVVLVTQQTNGNIMKSNANQPDDGLHFKETANKDLKNAFKQIANGETPAAPSGTGTANNFDSSVATSSSSKTSSNSNSNDDQNVPDNFPSNMQGTWYTYDSMSDQVITLKIDGNKVTSEGITLEVHKITPDQIKQNTANPPSSDSSHRYWAYFKSSNGWLNVYGWYQSAGTGTFYKVDTEDVNGQQVPVLEQASGASMNIDHKYYQSKNMAMQQKDHNQSSQNQDTQTADDD